MTAVGKKLPGGGDTEDVASPNSIRNWLLLAIPIALALRWFDANPILVFSASLIAIYPLAELMGEAPKPWQ